MTQIEFDSQMRELRCQKGAALNAINQLQGGVKEEIAAVDRQIKELRAKREKLNQQRIIYSNRRLEIEREWGEKIRKFYEENYTGTRELEDISEWALAKELRHRGYGGQLLNPEKTQEFIDHLNEQLNGTSGDDVEKE